MHMPAACAAHTDLARPQQKHKLAQLAGHDLMPDLALLQLRQGVTCHLQCMLSMMTMTPEAVAGTHGPCICLLPVLPTLTWLVHSRSTNWLNWLGMI